MREVNVVLLRIANDLDYCKRLSVERQRETAKRSLSRLSKEVIRLEKEASFLHMLDLGVREKKYHTLIDALKANKERALEVSSQFTIEYFERLEQEGLS